jgi:hypothetical protein
MLSMSKVLKIVAQKYCDYFYIDIYDSNLKIEINGMIFICHFLMLLLKKMKFKKINEVLLLNLFLEP